jgi:selenocysteine lyase/cysteine desulfurase
LIAKKKLFDPEGAPVIPGGGTVLFVTETDHLYLKDIESKEEGGTPAIVESIRSGLVIQVSLFIYILKLKRRSQNDKHIQKEK